ncbi:MAG: hypothetical protein RLZZ214_2332 [Verrucomicrobiota bacterium]|jgi:hypothetical protein
MVFARLSPAGLHALAINSKRNLFIAASLMKSKLFAPALLLLVTASSEAALVITINIANPAAVVITSVANNSLVAKDLTVNFDGGISFRNFFTANESITTANPLAISGTWTARGASASYNEMVTFAFNNAAVVPGVDLSIYNVAAVNSDDQNFTTTAAPFSGSSSVNMSAFTHLPAVGATGSVNSGFLSTQGGSIGTWVVVPEPSSAVLGLIGSLSLIRRRR